MPLTYSARIDGRVIRCLIGSDTDLSGATFCFSLMAPPAVESGGTLMMSLGGYGEVALPPLSAGTVHEVVLRHANPEFRPANRAWLPLGPYLRTKNGAVPLSFTNAGPTETPAPDGVAPRGVGLIPPLATHRPDDETVDLSGGLHCDDEAFGAVHALAARTDLGDFLSPTGAPVGIGHDPALPPEAYRLTITQSGIDLIASDRAGRFYGAVTLLHLIRLNDGQVPTGTIADAPRFEWRGQHLDCARHYYAPETILSLLDLMALMKLNRFHWHFADDESFRLEIDCYPELWQNTAIRGEGHLIPGLFGGGIRAGGSYPKAVAKRIIDHARALSIDVLPEIEVPAHALALNRAIPGLRDPGDNGAEVSVQGYRENTINPAVPKMWDVTHAIVDEVAELFPFGHLHLGCDELPHDTWSGSPAVAALKLREGLQTTDDVQGWTMEQLAARLRAKGKVPAAWEEAAKGSNGGIGHGAILFSWTGQGPGVAAARAGHPVVMCPAQNVYLDMAHTGATDDWGAAWAAFVDLEDTVNWSPIPQGAEDVAERVIGVQGTYWSEFTTTDNQIWPMLLPRILGVASMAWGKGGSLSGTELRQRAKVYAARLRGPWRWH